MDILEKILDIDHYEEYKELFKEKVRELETKVSKVSDKLSFLDENISKNLLLIKNKEDRIETYNKEKEDKIKDLTSRIEKLNSEIPKYEKYISDNTNIIEEYSKLQNQYGELNLKVSSIDEKIKLEYESLRNQYKNILLIFEKENLAEFKNKKESLLLELNNIKNTIDNMRKENEFNSKNITNEMNNKINEIKNSLKNEKHNIELKVSEIDSEARFLQNNINTLRNDYKLTKSELDKISGGLSQEVPVCSVCGQKISGDYSQNVIKHKEELTKKLEEIRINGDNLRIKLKELEDTKQKYTIELSNIEEKYKNDILLVEREYKEKITALYSNFTITLKEFESKKKEVEEKISKLQSDIDEILEKKKKELFEECNKRFSKIEEKLLGEKNDISAKLNELKNKIEQYSNQINEIERMKTILSNKLSEKLSLEKEIDITIKNHKKIVEAELLDIENLKNEIDAIINEKNNILENNKKDIRLIEICKFWASAFGDGGIKGMLIDEIIPFLNSKAKEYFNETPLRIGFSSISSTKTGDIRNKFNIDVVQTTNLSSFGELSSGEKRMVDIIVMFCLRSLYEHIKQVSMNLMLLDEVLDSLDEENSTLVTNFLKKISSNITIILISHTLRGRNLDVDGFCEVYKFG